MEMRFLHMMSPEEFWEYEKILGIKRTTLKSVFNTDYDDIDVMFLSNKLINELRR